MRYPQDFLEKVLRERKRKWAEEKYFSLREIGLANGVELERKAHGNSPPAPDFYTTADGYYDQLRDYHIMAGWSRPTREMTLDESIDAEFDGFIRRL